MVDEGLVPYRENCLYTLIEQAAKHGLASLHVFHRQTDWQEYRGNVNTRRREAMKVMVPDERRPSLLKVGAIDFEMPFSGKFYTKQEALRYIPKTTKASDERGAMIRFMVQGGYVLCKEKCLSDLVRRVEVDHLPVGSDKWGKQGRPTNEAWFRITR